MPDFPISALTQVSLKLTMLLPAVDMSAGLGLKNVSFTIAELMSFAAANAQPSGGAALVVGTPGNEEGTAELIALTSAHIQGAVEGTDFSQGSVTATGGDAPRHQADVDADNVNVASFVGGLQAALVAGTALARPARVVIPGGVYAFAAPVTATLGTGSLSVEAMGRATLNFAAGVSGIAVTNGTSGATGSHHRGLTLNTANTAPGNVAFSLSNPSFGTGGVPNESFVEKFRVNGQWGTAFYFDGVPQLTVKDCSVSPDYGTTGTTFFDFECTNPAVISTTYSLLNCRGFTAGYIAVKIGPNIQGMIIDDLSTFGTTYGIYLTTGTASGDISSSLELSNSNIGAVTVLSITGNAASSLVDFECTNSYFYGPSVAGTPFVNIQYVNSVFIDNSEVAPNTPAPFTVGNSNNINITATDITASSVSLEASNVISIVGGIWGTPSMSGLCQDLTIAGVTFEEATTFTLSGPNNQITGCNFMAAPNFSGSTVGLSNNWFQGVYYAVGAPPATLGAGQQNPPLTAYGQANNLAIQGASTGNSSQLVATGSDANVSVEVAAKGTGGFFLVNGDGICLSVFGLGQIGILTDGGFTLSNALGVLFSIGTQGTAAQVNSLAVLSAPTGNGPQLSANGSDADIDISLVAKGAGIVLIANGAGTLLEIASAGNFNVGAEGTGVVFGNMQGTLLVAEPNSGTAAQVNYPVLISADTGSGVQFLAMGSDANIDLTLAPKGTGTLNLNGPVYGADLPTVAPAAGSKLWWNNNGVVTIA